MSTLAERIINPEKIARTVSLIAPAGSRFTRRTREREMQAAIASIRKAAETSVEHVYAITGLEAAHNLRDSQVLVIDRATWAKANAQAFRIMAAPFIEPLFASLESKNPKSIPLASSIVSAEIGAVLSYLSTAVLGQYDPYAALAGYGPAGGRLMLVAPNIVSLEKELNLEPEDFYLWVCLHEQTHRVQFAAAPWLREHFLSLISHMGEHTAANIEVSKLGGLGRSLNSDSESDSSIAQPTEEIRRIGAELNAVMSLLEGHANVVMDAIDASIVPSVKTIRQRFDRRSSIQKIVRRALNKLLGMEKKLAQYKNGQKFVQHIVDQRGMEEFNRVWERAENLPSEAEIHDPDAWIARVLESKASESSAALNPAEQKKD
ncbi:MAG: zinc-dependent metalloprotease [Rothia sp. (in: high G+C Gram-positive bacteria)]|uniref:zinc-dependent metalloprotease n=1 Tax=Rothia sp. (in: high G+C Gram-positive bacteria) TaxID=1885016 RepID=UPI0026DF3382|nr:zinc-dependent metalloprotease [Rothia sp. (in: high G+C Gram-positive bacteria)]MDO5749722.1 zinc-dependent metalloprotease [Rothia sp. (in: high G+C Gram-positive bacteria)]